jgi:hypothetical protein
MNASSFVVAAAALVAISPAFAEAPKGAPVEPQRDAREPTVVEELAAGMREVLRAVVPAISIPALELKLPTLDRAAR